MPVVACVQGDALGFGAALAGCCDITLVSSAARFAFPEIEHNIPATLGVSAASTEKTRVHPRACRASVTELVGDQSGELIKHVGCQVAAKERACRYARGSFGRSESVDQPDHVVGVLRLVASHNRVCLEAEPGSGAGCSGSVSRP